MASTRQQREEVVAVLTKELEGAEGVFVAEYKGVKTPELNELRAKLRPLGGSCRVVKNTLSKIALKNRGINGMDGFFEGMSAVILQRGDMVETTKVVIEFAKSHENYKLRAGYLQGRVMETSELKALATMPPRQVLIAQLAGNLLAPVSQFHGVMHAMVRSAAGALHQVALKKEKEGQAA